MSITTHISHRNRRMPLEKQHLFFVRVRFILGFVSIVAFWYPERTFTRKYNGLGKFYTWHIVNLIMMSDISQMTKLN